LIIRLYFDEDSMRHALVMALRTQGMGVTTAIEAQMIGRKDEAHLSYATQQGCVLYSFNRGDFYRLHTQYLTQGKSHAGIILATQQQYAVREEVRRLRKLATILSAEEMLNRVEFLSAWG
jgi:hypothetical protein